jgi:hypothetical protein
VTVSGKTGALRAALWLTIAMAAGWAVCFWPARYLRGSAGVQWMSVAAICCLIPGWFVVFLSGLAIVRSELSAMLLQTGVRLFSVSGAALVVRTLKPEFGLADFFGWLVGFYLLALVVEVNVFRQQHQLQVGRSSRQMAEPG